MITTKAAPLSLNGHVDAAEKTPVMLLDEEGNEESSCDVEQAIHTAQLLREDFLQDKTDFEIPEVEGTLVTPLAYEYAAVGGQSQVSDAPPPAVEAFPISMRAEFLYASAILPAGGSAGIHLQARSNFGVSIRCFDEDSPLRGSNIHPGDHVIAINNLSCADADLARVEKLIASSTGSISVCVHNLKGDPHLVSSSVQKPNVSAKVGLTMKTREGVVYFNKIYKGGLFGKSLLMPQHRCVVINGVSCNHIDARMVGEIIAEAKDRVTIVSKPQTSQSQEAYATTIALYEHQKWWKNVLFGAGVAAGAVAAVGSFS